ncbi:MAG: hypothetical protein Q9M17_08920 [Mariprofundus sp.]|nr:hypothetical protein [Mariprofundus sp.]
MSRNKQAHLRVRRKPTASTPIDYPELAREVMSGSIPGSSAGGEQAETRLIEMDNRLFLESQRFDRSGAYGRMSMLSLQSVDAEFAGLGSGWPQVMKAPYKEQLISWDHVSDTEFLWYFGRLINNTGMHLGNLSLAIDGSVFRLLPVYGMCSMGFAPKSGEVTPYSFIPPEIKRLNLNDRSIALAKDMAQNFWNRVANDERISDEFKVID